MNDPFEGLSKDELRQLALESMIRLEKAGRIADVIKIINRTPAKPSTQADKEELLTVAMRLDELADKRFDENALSAENARVQGY